MENSMSSKPANQSLLNSKFFKKNHEWSLFCWLHWVLTCLVRFWKNLFLVFVGLGLGDWLVDLSLVLLVDLSLVLLVDLNLVVLVDLSLVLLVDLSLVLLVWVWEIGWLIWVWFCWLIWVWFCWLIIYNIGSQLDCWMVGLFNETAP